MRIPQREVARRMSISDRQVRKLKEEAIQKGVPVIASEGMAICYDPEIIQEEAQKLLNHAKAELATAASLIQTLHAPQQEVRAEIETMLKMLPVIEAKNESFDSTVDFPFMKLG